LTDEAISHRETFASDSDDLALTYDEEPRESGAAVVDDDSNSIREMWFSKMLRDLTLCRLATRLRSYDYCGSVCQSWLSELSAKNVIGAIAVAFGCFDCVTHLRKRKPDRSLLSSQVLMSLTFNEAGQPINNAVSLVLKGGEALCYAWNQDYGQSLSSFEMACKCAKDVHAATRDINAAALMQSFDQMAKLVCKAAEIKHRSLIEKYKIDATEPVQTFASGQSQSSSPDALSTNVDLGLTVKRVDAGWMIVKVHQGILKR
jgi:hypothetical protein